MILSDVAGQFLGGSRRISLSYSIRLTFIGARGLIESAQGDVGRYQKADHKQEASNALNCHGRHFPAHDPPPVDQ